MARQCAIYSIIACSKGEVARLKAFKRVESKGSSLTPQVKGHHTIRLILDHFADFVKFPQSRFFSLLDHCIAK